MIMLVSLSELHQENIQSGLRLLDVQARISLEPADIVRDEAPQSEGGRGPIHRMG